MTIFKMIQPLKLTPIFAPVGFAYNNLTKPFKQFHSTFSWHLSYEGQIGRIFHSLKTTTNRLFFFAYHRQSYPLILFRNPLNRVLRVFNRIKYISYCQTLHCPMIPFIRWELAFSHSLTTIYILQCRVYAAYWVERI